MCSSDLDYWHDVRQLMARRFGPEIALLPLCTAAGDLSPHLWLQTRAENRMLKLAGKSLREDLAVRLLAAMERTLAICGTERFENPTLLHRVETLQLPARLISATEVETERRNLAQLELTAPPDNLYDRSRHEARIHRCRNVILRYERQQEGTDRIPQELHVFRLGELGFVTCPQELFLDFALEIQAQSPALSTVVVQLAGSGIHGYIPTAKAEAGGSYSACIYCNNIGSDGGIQLVRRSVELLKILF